MERPETTRLRFVSAKDPQVLVDFLDSLGVRIQVYGAPTWNGKRWFMWFVPSDFGADIQSIEL